MNAPAPIRKPPPVTARASEAAAGPRAESRQTAVWRRLAVLSATFTLVVATLMLVDYRRSVAEDPLEAQASRLLREQLRATPANITLRQQLRAADLRERQLYFSRVRRNRIGAILLLGGALTSLVSATRLVALSVRAPEPRPLCTWTDLERASRQAVLAVGITSGAVLGGVIAIALVHREPEAFRQPAVSLVGTADSTAQQARAQGWLRFRGSDGSGASGFTNIPARWDVATRENIAWVTAVPLAGHSSPVIVGDRLFLTGADQTRRELYCFDTLTGLLRWRLPAALVSGEAVARMQLPNLTGASAPTPAADAQRVYAMFGTGELIVADHDGHLVWSRNFGKPQNPYGHATSLVTWNGLLIVQLDQGEARSTKSRVYALDGVTGHVVWQTDRALPSSWATPVVIRAGGIDQVVCIGEPFVISYAADDGHELWRFDGMGSDLTPSPIFAAGLVLAVNPNQQIFAIRADGRGDITRTHLAWKVEENVPDITSPASQGELLFMLETRGNLVCLESTSGRKLWEHGFEGEFHASPAVVGDRVLLISLEGEAIMVKAARDFGELGHNTFAEPVKASPAVTDGRMFVRGATNLFCVANTPRPGGVR